MITANNRHSSPKFKEAASWESFQNRFPGNSHRHSLSFGVTNLYSSQSSQLFIAVILPFLNNKFNYYNKNGTKQPAIYILYYTKLRKRGTQNGALLPI